MSTHVNHFHPDVTKAYQASLDLPCRVIWRTQRGVRELILSGNGAWFRLLGVRKGLPTFDNQSRLFWKCVGNHWTTVFFVHYTENRDFENEFKRNCWRCSYDLGTVRETKFCTPVLPLFQYKFLPLCIFPWWGASHHEHPLTCCLLLQTCPVPTDHPWSRWHPALSHYCLPSPPSPWPPSMAGDGRHRPATWRRPCSCVALPVPLPCTGVGPILEWVKALAKWSCAITHGLTAKLYHYLYLLIVSCIAGLGPCRLWVWMHHFSDLP
jgi:hypothetical protein